MIADLSTGGASLYSRKPDYQAGDALRLELYIAIDSQTPRIAHGKVVRVEPLPIDRASLWTHQVAVQFDAPIAIAPDEVRALEERQAKFGLKR
jgi:hypothetical protein